MEVWFRRVKALPKPVAERGRECETRQRKRIHNQSGGERKTTEETVEPVVWVGVSWESSLCSNEKQHAFE